MSKCDDCGEGLKAHAFDSSGFIYNKANNARCNLGKGRWD